MLVDGNGFGQKRKSRIGERRSGTTDKAQTKTVVSRSDGASDNSSSSGQQTAGTAAAIGEEEATGASAGSKSSPLFPQLRSLPDFLMLSSHSSAVSPRHDGLPDLVSPPLTSCPLFRSSYPGPFPRGAKIFDPN